MAAVPAVQELLGDALRDITADGDIVSPSAADELAVDYVWFYFGKRGSESCIALDGPIRSSFATVSGADGAGSMRLVYCSLDDNESDLMATLRSAPGLFIAHSGAGREALLEEWASIITGVPTVIIYRPSDGKIVTSDAATEIQLDAAGSNFPWEPWPLKKALGDTLLAHDDRGSVTTVPVSSLDDKYLGLYFSASWCPPCKIVTPQLVSVYNDLKAEGKELEIALVSRDRSQEEFRAYHKQMPWLAVPFESDERLRLQLAFHSPSIPFLVILAPDRSVAVVNAHMEVLLEPARFPWPARIIEPLYKAPARINDHRVLVIFAEEMSGDAQQTLTEALTPVATVWRDRGLLSYMALTPTKLGLRLRMQMALGVPGELAECVVVDIADAGGFYVCASDGEQPTADGVAAFLTAVADGSHPRSQMRRA